MGRPCAPITMRQGQKGAGPASTRQKSRRLLDQNALAHRPAGPPPDVPLDRWTPPRGDPSAGPAGTRCRHTAWPRTPTPAPQRVCADKGYSSRTFRQYLRQHGIEVVIPRKRTERRRGPFDAGAYRERHRIEQCFNRLKQFRRIATRDEKLACHYLAMLTIACIVLWL